MPWQNLYAADKEFTGACMKMGWKTFPSNIHPPGPHNELCLWRNIREELVQSSLSNFYFPQNMDMATIRPMGWAQNLAGLLFIYFLLLISL